VSNNQLGLSSTAQAFGATIDLNIPNQGLYLIVGRQTPIAGLVRSAGGHIPIQIPQNKALAVLPVEAFLMFRQHPDIAFIGPVSVDQTRFAKFISGINRAQASNTS
jgi:hypothetical protein